MTDGSYPKKEGNVKPNVCSPSDLHGFLMNACAVSEPQKHQLIQLPVLTTKLYL